MRSTRGKWAGECRTCHGKEPESHELWLGPSKLDGDALPLCLPRGEPFERLVRRDEPVQPTAELGAGRVGVLPESV
jgi:hypothetical protein